MTFDPWADEAAPERVEAPAGELSLLAVEFDDPLKAQEALLASLRLAKRGAIRLDDAAIVTKSPSGKIRIHQTKDTSAGQGAAAGGWVGMLAGLVFMAPLVGAVLGAAIGGIWAKLRDIGISDRQMAEMGEALESGDAALFLLFRPEAPTTLLRELRRFDGAVLFSSLDDDLTGDIAAALDEIV
jgi:uncharacterized membrane protein